MNGKGRLGEQEDGNRKKAEGFIYIVFCRAIQSVLLWWQYSDVL